MVRYILGLLFILKISGISSSKQAGIFRSRVHTGHATTLNSFDNFGDAESSRANLLFDKKFLTNVFALGWKVEVEYLLFNVGNEVAIDVHISDQDFVSEGSKFNVTQGQADFRIGRILPGANFTVNITAIPNALLEVGSFKFHPAKVTYRSRSLGDEEEVLENVIRIKTTTSLFECSSRFQSRFHVIHLICTGNCWMVQFVSVSAWNCQYSQSRRCLSSSLPQNGRLCTVVIDCDLRFG